VTFLGREEKVSLEVQMKFAERVCRIYSLSSRETANSVSSFSKQFCHIHQRHSVCLQIDPICIVSENLTTVNFTGKFRCSESFSTSVALHLTQDIIVLENNSFDVTDWIPFFVDNPVIFSIRFLL
jgi:hypothetical protein